MGEASIKVYRGLERVYNEIGRDLSANLLTISTDKTPFAINSRLVGKPEAIRKRVEERGRISNDKSLEVMAMAPRVPRVSQALWEVARWSELGPLF